MKLLLIAANSRTGRQVAKLASNDIKVRSFIRMGVVPAFEIKNTEIFYGDAQDFNSIKKALKDIDVVISTIGHVRGSDKYVQTETIANICRAVKELGTKTKIVSLTGTGVRVDMDKITIMDRLLNLVISVIDPARVKDGRQHYKILKESGITYSVIRVLKLTNTLSNNNPELTENGPAKTFVSRTEVARALLIAAKQPKWDNKAPMVSK